MERRSVTLSGRSVAYLAGTTSWHPTFEVVFVAADPRSTLLAEDIARALTSYSNVFVLEAKALRRGRRDADTVEGLLAWTQATRVRRPLLAASANDLGTALGFARRYPQFVLGIVALPDPPPSGTGGAVKLAIALLRAATLVPKALLHRGRDRGPDVDKVPLEDAGVPHLDLRGTSDTPRAAAEIRRFAQSIKLDSPARERRPRRPWAVGRTQREG